MVKLAGGFLGTIIGFSAYWFYYWDVTWCFFRRRHHDRTDKKKAFNATKGAFLGFIYGTGF